MNDFSLEADRVRRSFDRAAQSYDPAAALQRRVADTLLTQLTTTTPHAILDAGCGTGYGTALLHAHFSTATICALDLAPGMLNATEARGLDRLTFVNANAESLPFTTPTFDLIWSSLMLQWCVNLHTTYAGFYQCLQPGGRIALSTFGPETLHELASSFNDRHTHVSRFPAVETHIAALAAAGFADIQIEARPDVQHYPDVRALMLELKAIGAHNATGGRARGLTGKTAWQQMLARYELLRGTKGLPATYEIFYLHARKP